MILGELLVKGQVISQQQLNNALTAQRAYGGLIGEHLLHQQALSADTLRYYLNQQSALLLEEEHVFLRLRLIKDLFKRFCATAPSYIFLCLLFLLLSVCLSISFPFYVKFIFDVLIYAQDFTSIIYLSLFVLAAQVFARWFLYYASQLFNATNVAFSNWLRRTLYQKITLMRYSTYIRYGSGNLLNRVTTDVDNVITRWEHAFINFFKNCFSIIISVAVLIFIDPWLTLGVLVLSIVIVVVPGQISNRANAALSQRPGFHSQVVSLFKDQLYGFKLLKSFNIQHAALHKLNSIFDEYYLNDHHMVKYWNLAFNLRTIFGYSLSGLVLFVGGYNVMQGTYSLGDLALFILTVNMLAPYTDEFMLLIISVNDIKRYWKRCFEILQLNIDEQRFQSDNTQYNITGAIHLDRITFGYGDKIIFRDLTLNIETNKSYGVIGRSGSGKSTLLKLLLKDVLPHQGCIWYDSYDITGLSEHTLARHVSYISQSPLLFPDTVYENIRLGALALHDTEPSADEIYNAAEMSGIHQRVMNLPQGYQTIIGEGAYQLSGGEKQRISIARALMKSPKVFLFDEPTASLDPDNERLVLASMKALMGRHTMLICTHNMRLLEDVDYIIFVDGACTRMLRRSDVSFEKLITTLDTTIDPMESVLHGV